MVVSNKNTFRAKAIIGIVRHMFDKNEAIINASCVVECMSHHDNNNNKKNDDNVYS